MTWQPSGASEASSIDAMDTRTKLRGASTPRAQSSNAAHCAGSASDGSVGRPAASIPTCKCRNESQRVTCAEIVASTSTPSTRHLLDGVAVPAHNPTLVGFDTARDPCCLFVEVLCELRVLWY